MTSLIPRRTMIAGTLALGAGAVLAGPADEALAATCVNGTDPNTVSGTATTVVSFAGSPNSDCPDVYAEVRHMSSKALGWARVTLKDAMPYDDRYGITPELTVYLERHESSGWVVRMSKKISSPKKGTQYWTRAACTEHFSGTYRVRVKWFNGDGTAGVMASSASGTLKSSACPFTGTP